MRCRWYVFSLYTQSLRNIISCSPTSITTADRRPIDPPPIVQLRVIDHNRRSNKSSSNNPNPNHPSVPQRSSESPSPQPHHLHPHPHAHPHSGGGHGPGVGAGAGGSDDGHIDASMLTPAGVGGTLGGPGGFGQTYLQNPYYFMFASLAKPDEDIELHWMKVCHSFLFSSCACSVLDVRSSRSTSTRLFRVARCIPWDPHTSPTWLLLVSLGFSVRVRVYA